MSQGIINSTRDDEISPSEWQVNLELAYFSTRFYDKFIGSVFTIMDCSQKYFIGIGTGREGN